MKNGSINVTTFSEARANLKSVMDRVVEDHVPIVISRRKADPVVMMSLSDWNGWQETVYLNSTEANRKALEGSIAQLNTGEVVEAEFGADDGISRMVGDAAE